MELYDEPPSPGDRWTDLLDPTYLHDNGTSDLLTANKTILQTSQGLNYLWPVELLDSLTGCSLPADTILLGETQAPVEPLLRHPSTSYAYSLAAADTGTFEDVKTNLGAVRMMVQYDALPLSIGMWQDCPTPEEWDSLAPHGKVRNLRGREAVTAYREHAGQPFHYTVLSYDERGRVEALLRYTENLGFDAVYYSYNSMNQVTAVRVADPLRQYTTWYGYDYNGRVDSVWIKLQAVGSGLGVSAPTYPHTANRPNDPDIVYSYTKTGQVDTMRYPLPNVYVAYSYTKRKWLDSIQAWQQVYTPFPTLSSVFTETLSYDSTGQIIQQQWKHAGQGSQQQDYVYDAVQRLVGWKNGSGDSTFYQYDNIGNRNYAGGVGSATWDATSSYDRSGHGPDQLQTLLTNSGPGLLKREYIYSADGAVTGRRDTNITNSNQLERVEGYSQSYRGLLTGYTLNDVPNARTEAWGYHYNAMGEREQKRLYDMQGIVEGWDGSKPWVYYLLGGSREQLAVYHGREQLAFSCGEPGPGVAFYPVEYNTYSGGTAPLTTRPDPVIANGTKEYRVLDHLGSVRVVLNALGVASATDYAPFGKAITANEPRQGWIDKEKDRESGLGDFGVRKYEVEEGRFTSIDPLWDKFLDKTPYNYGENNPVKLKDPNGDCIQCLILLAEAAAEIGALVVASVVLIKTAQELSKVHVESEAQSAPQTPTNENPYAGPVDKPVTIVDEHGNAIPVKAGEQVQGSPDGTWIQVKDKDGNPTGLRKDGAHKPDSHPDPRAQQPHAHAPGYTNPDGTPWLPVNQQVP